MSNLVEKIAKKMVLGPINYIKKFHLNLVSKSKYYFLTYNARNFYEKWPNYKEQCTFQVENLHEVYILLDGEEQTAAFKLKDSLDQLHQSKALLLFSSLSTVTLL